MTVSPMHSYNTSAGVMDVWSEDCGVRMFEGYTVHKEGEINSRRTCFKRVDLSTAQKPAFPVAGPHRRHSIGEVAATILS